MERTLVLLLLGLCALARAQSSGSGSGSGNGTVEEMRNCSDLRCSHGCNETDEGPMCYCPSGYSLSEDMRTCQPCRGGLFGVNCASMCNCGDTGNTCDRTSGVCICNPCYEGDQCERERSLDCYVQFLELPDKSLDNLRNFYGDDGYPRPQAGQTTLPQSLAAQIMDTDPALVSDVEFEPVSRREVDQGDLVKLSWRVFRNRDPAGAEEALMTLSNKVKLGNIRATYIAQDSTDNSQVLVTLNSGVKEDPN